MNRKPVHIITGFLGAGKTTFLNHLIKEQLPERIFVIENECGATNIDGGLVMDGVEDLVELTAGCLCCSLADGLLDILEDAYKRREEYDRLVIETTGIADPSSIVQVFLENPAVEKAFDLQQVICLVDAGQVKDWLNEAEEALRQISVADVLLVNKADTVSQEQVKEVTELLKGINVQAKTLAGSQGKFDLKTILSVGTTKPESVESLAQVHEHQHEHSTTDSNSHKITTFTLTFAHPLDLNELQLDLNRIVHLYREQVYRVKGFIAIPNYPNRVILQSVRSSFIATDGSPWETPKDRVGKLVFIGRGLQKQTFEKMFKRHMVRPD
ncbi:CobW family GTP-binding protein [Reichenbachiella sp.]|uniref:CobW family GTP-binding protein n=1 Tax=Reichenbachiella sp. TaxID=2184521 RepID=UPI003B5C11C0